MVKLLFVHGTKFKQDDSGNLYTGGSYSSEIWKRYLIHTSRLTVLARTESKIYSSVEAKKNFNLFNHNEISFKSLPDIRSSFKSFYSKKNRENIEELIKNEVKNSDYIIIRLPCNYGNIAVKYAKKYNKPYLLEVVGCSWDALWHYNWKGKVLAPISFMKQRRSIINSSHVIYVTSSFLQSRYPTEGRSINCSNVSIPSVSSEVLENRIVKITSSFNGNKRLKIGTIGSLDAAYKGQDIVIKALSYLKSVGIRNYEYHLVGSGEGKRLKKLVKELGLEDQVFFKGTLPHQKINEWLDNIDLYIQPSKTEGLPRGLIEAMHRGLCALGTNVGGIPELLDSSFLLSTKKENYKEISTILKNIEINDLIEQGEKNFWKSESYSKELINERRYKFIKEFISNE